MRLSNRKRGSGRGRERAGERGRERLREAGPGETIFSRLSTLLSPTPTLPLPRSHALSLSRSLHLPLSRSPLLSAPIMFALFVSFLSLPIFVSFFVIVVFDGADERAAYGRGHS